MNKEEIIQAKDKLNHCIEFYENMCEPREVQPILTGEEKKALKSLLRYNDNLEQQNQKYKEVIDKANKLLKEKVKVIPFDEKGEGGGLELTDYDIQDLLDILKESGE